MMLKTWKQINYYTFSPYIARSKGNQAKKFDQLIEYRSSTVYYRAT